MEDEFKKISVVGISIVFQIEKNSENLLLLQFGKF